MLDIMTLVLIEYDLEYMLHICNSYGLVIYWVQAQIEHQDKWSSQSKCEDIIQNYLLNFITGLIEESQCYKTKGSKAYPRYIHRTNLKGPCKIYFFAFKVITSTTKQYFSRPYPYILTY